MAVTLVAAAVGTVVDGDPQLTLGKAHQQAFARRHLSGASDYGAVAALQHGIASLERRRGGERPHPGPDVLDVAAAAFDRVPQAPPGPFAQVAELGGADP